MSALITLLLSHAKLVLITVAVVGTATVATVAGNDVPATTEWAELSADDLTHEAETPEPLAAEEADELLAEFAAACGADAVAPDLTGLSEDEAEAAVEPLVEACEDAAETPEPLAAEEADELLAEFAAACGADAVAPDLTGLSEDEAEAAVEPLIEACEDAAETPEPLAAEEADELLAEFAAACGADAVAPDLTGLSENEAEAAVEPLIEACEDAAELESDDADGDDEDTEDASESESDDADGDDEDTEDASESESDDDEADEED